MAPGDALPLRMPEDTHGAQALRIADYSDANPGAFFSADELKAACDLGCPTKVLSAMALMLGYELEKRWRPCVVVHGTRSRAVRVYRVTRRPAPRQLSLLETP